MQPFHVPVQKLFPEGVDLLLRLVDLRKQLQVLFQDQSFGQFIHLLDPEHHGADLFLDRAGKMKVMPDGPLGIFCKIIRNLRNPHDISHIVVEGRDIFLIGQLALGGQTDQIIYDGMINAACLVDLFQAGFDQALILFLKGTVCGSKRVHRGIRQQDHFFFQLGNGDGSGGEHPFVQVGYRGFGLLFLDQ